MTAGDDRRSALLLSFVAGFVDTFSFVVLFGLFTAHVTGNFVLIGAAFAGHGHAGVVGKLLALPTFVLAIAATRWLQRRWSDAPAPFVLIQCVALLAFMACGLALGPSIDPDAAATVATGQLGVAAMAVQNALSRSAFATLGPTTVMTGNVTQVTMDLVDRWLAQDGASDDAARIGKMWPPLVSFAAGAVAAGLLGARSGFVSLLLPAALLAVLWWRLRAGASMSR